MGKKQFKAESRRLLDMMINSIYTHQEIFLRELISNASDAIDKLCFLSLTDEKVGLSREDFRIRLVVDTENNTLTVSDNGVGMTQEACENIMHPEASTGMGIAVKNVHDRLFGYFGPESKMEVESELGKGTTVTLVLHNSSE